MGGRKELNRQCRQHLLPKFSLPAKHCPFSLKNVVAKFGQDRQLTRVIQKRCFDFSSSRINLFLRNENIFFIFLCHLTHFFNIYLYNLHTSKINPNSRFKINELFFGVFTNFWLFYVRNIRERFQKCREELPSSHHRLLCVLQCSSS